MSPERHGAHVPRRWWLRSTFGELAFACLLIAALTGLPLAVPFDIRSPFDSLALILLANPAAAFFRNLHYWSAQLFLVFTLAHAWDHLRRRTEGRLTRGAWLRTALTLPLGGFVLLSGFILKGDAEGQQAARILSAILEQVPAAGHALSLLLLGSEGNRQLLYVHHAATATILLWLFVAEHARSLWPRAVTVIETVLGAACLSAFLSPALHDGLEPIAKGPWYFLGLQETLHWVSRGGYVLAGAAVLLVLLIGLPRLSDRAGSISKWLLAAAVAVYAVLTVAGVFFRGEAWAWGFAWSGRTSGLVAHGLGVWWGAPLWSLEQHPIPVVLGHREGCLFCHAATKGLSASHSAEAAGCSSCHRGNPFSLDAATAHAGMLLVPGTLADADRSCGSVSCHAGIPVRVRTSLMNTMAGVVGVDRAVISGRWPAAGTSSVASLERTGADSHLRLLCASCHVGGERTGWGPLRETTRGGGCNACHLAYSAEATRQLARYEGSRREGRAVHSPSVHPNLSIDIGRVACFGCHSRSGRISTSYEGWHETQLAAVPAGDGHRYRELEDGRVFQFVQADIHADKGMSCVDCHTAREAMGDGVPHGRKYEAVRVTCEGCHGIGPPSLGAQSRQASMNETGPSFGAASPPSLGAQSRQASLNETGPSSGAASGSLRGIRRQPDLTGLGPGEHTARVSELDAESQKIARLRGLPPTARVVLAPEPLLNTSTDSAGAPWLTPKGRAERLPLRPAAPVCVEGRGHARLSCVSCHGAWAPRCTGCHTRFDPAREGVDLLDGRTVKGDWVETGSGFSAVPPTLGIRQDGSARLATGRAGARPGPGTVDTFIPGMVLSFDRNQAPGKRPDNVFRRLYARAFSHTVSKGARSCESCHNDPVAIGYGEGALRYERDGEAGRWRFVSRHSPDPDGLPADAWIGFLQDRSGAVSTRSDVRPFTVEEQKRILTVGACLTCHRPDSPALRHAVTDWRGTWHRTTAACRLPRW